MSTKNEKKDRHIHYSDHINYINYTDHTHDIDHTIFEFKLNNLNTSIFITDTPKDSSIEKFTQFMNDRCITDVFCFSHLEYTVPSNISNTSNKINFHQLEIPDGTYPDNLMLDKFNKMIDEIIETNNNNNINILFHCKAGLGRAPVMLAYMMISRLGMNPLDCVELIRKKRKGAINTNQLRWLDTTKFKKILNKSNKSNNSNCIIV